MPERRFGSVDEYIQHQSPEVQKVLQAVRKAIKDAVPDAVESISYNMPTFDYKGRLLHFAAFQDHYSVFGATPRVERSFAKELSGYRLGRGTIQFPYSKPVPDSLIAGIARQKAEENDKAQKD